MRKDYLNAPRILKQTAVAQNLIDDFFSNFDCQMTFPEEGF